MVDKAYTPLEQPNKELIDKELNEIPPYEDKGVKFQTYSKTKLGQNNFKLNPQTPFYYVGSTGSLSGATVSNDIGYPPKGKKLYITALHFRVSVGTLSSASYFRIRDTYYTKVNTIFRYNILGSGYQSISFNPPLIINGEYDTTLTPSGCQIGVSSGASGVINDFSYNLQGFIE